MNQTFLYYLPPVAAVTIYWARLAELRARRQTIAGVVRENVTLRAFIATGSFMLAGSLVEYHFARPPFCWPLLVGGVGIALFSFYVRRRAIAALGRFWSLHVEIRDQHQLVREGPFRYVRHPAYSTMVLEILSIALIMQSWIVGVLAYVAFIPTLIARIRIEERALVDKFGPAYVEFKRTTPALVPRFWGRA